MKTLTIAAVVVLAALTGTTLGVTSTPCATEDSTLCYWDGSTRGNRTGDSFIALTDGLAIVWDGNGND